MKRIVLLSSVAALAIVSCVKNPDGDKAETTEAAEVTAVMAGESLEVDKDASSVVWTGAKVTGSHTGFVKIKSGHIKLEEGNVIGGDIVLDMTTITDEDLTGEYKTKLEEHLKSDDFFSVATYPEANFVISDVKPGANATDLVVSGNLTIKGITKNITFNAVVDNQTENYVKVLADFNILREDWGVNYTGKKDDLISKEINFKVTLVAKQ